MLISIAVLNAAFSPNRDEVLRVNSPSGDSVAIVVEVNGGATTSFAYEVLVKSTGLRFGNTKVASFYRPLRNFNAYGVNPRWVSNDELQIEYFSSRFDEVISPVYRFSDPPIRVVLKPGVIDAAAPAGSMLNNLR